MRCIWIATVALGACALDAPTEPSPDATVALDVRPASDAAVTDCERQLTGMPLRPDISRCLIYAPTGGELFSAAGKCRADTEDIPYGYTGYMVCNVAYTGPGAQPGVLLTEDGVTCRYARCLTAPGVF